MIDRYALGADLRDNSGDGAPKDELVLPVEIRARLRQRLSLPSPCDSVGERADANRQLERPDETATPRLEIRVAQAREPRVGRRQLIDLLKETERYDERRERVRDRRVAPVE